MRRIVSPSGEIEGPSSERTRVRRLPERGSYDRAFIDSILDEGLVCHVSFAAGGHPFVIPTTYARRGDLLYFHGLRGSRMMKHLRDGHPVAIAVTLLDGIVMARSAFHHSMNYRSVVVFGKPREVTDPDEKAVALDALVDHLVPGRRDHIRGPNQTESSKTLVAALQISEVSAKTRSGPPGDDEVDYELDTWAGVVPLELTPGPPEADPLLRAGIATPDHAQHYTRSPRPRQSDPQKGSPQEDLPA